MKVWTQRSQILAKSSEFAIQQTGCSDPRRLPHHRRGHRMVHATVSRRCGAKADVEQGCVVRQDVLIRIPNELMETQDGLVRLHQRATVCSIQSNLSSLSSPCTVRFSVGPLSAKCPAARATKSSGQDGEAQ